LYKSKLISILKVYVDENIPFGRDIVNVITGDTLLLAKNILCIIGGSPPSSPSSPTCDVYAAFSPFVPYVSHFLIRGVVDVV